MDVASDLEAPEEAPAPEDAEPPRWRTGARTAWVPVAFLAVVALVTLALVSDTDDTEVPPTTTTVDEDAFTVGTGDDALVFELPFEQRWHAAARLLGIELSRISTQAGRA